MGCAWGHGLCMAIWPQRASASVDALEPELRHPINHGAPVEASMRSSLNSGIRSITGRRSRWRSSTRGCEWAVNGPWDMNGLSMGCDGLLTVNGL
jgi:hypothetical protein